MTIIKPFVEAIEVRGDAKDIEKHARKCYQSTHLVGPGSAERLVDRLATSEHTAMLEFVDVIVELVCSRGCSHELVRHRLASYAQESTRFCNYAKDHFGSDVTFILPNGYSDVLIGQWTLDDMAFQFCDLSHMQSVWFWHMNACEKAYMSLVTQEASQIARGVLPIDLKTSISIKANLTEWHHILKMRTGEKAHPEIRGLMTNVLKHLCTVFPSVFGDLQ